MNTITEWAAHVYADGCGCEGCRASAIIILCDAVPHDAEPPAGLDPDVLHGARLDAGWSHCECCDAFRPDVRNHVFELDANAACTCPDCAPVPCDACGTLGEIRFETLPGVFVLDCCEACDGCGFVEKEG